MGRRAIPKIDPTLDLSRHLFTLDDLPQPWNAAVLYNRSAQLEVEVGTGKGLFIRRAAAANRAHDFLGIEVSEKYARLAAANAVKDRLDNVRIVHGDGLRLLREFLPDESVSAVHVYFPDPWWKRRHRKRRVLNELFLRDVERILIPKGHMHFWTDVKEYFDTSLDLIGRVTSLRGPFEIPEASAEHRMDYHTHFERRVRMHGRAIYRAEFEK